MINNIFITIQKGLHYLHQTLELAKKISNIKYFAAGKSVNNKMKK